jgi:hypothetical protein
MSTRRDIEQVAVEEPVLEAAFEASAKECNDHEQAVRVEGIMRCAEVVFVNDLPALQAS